MAILLSASALGAPDLFKLRNQTAAYWAAHHITRLVGSRLGRAFLSIYYYLGVRPRSSEREDGFSRVRERRRAEADEDPGHGPGWTPYTESNRYWRHARGVPPVRVSS